MGRWIDNRKGFTLVELMIVLLIITLLAIVAIPNLMKARLNARITRVATNLKVFGDAFQMYSFDKGVFPADAHIALPPGMSTYIMATKWAEDALGGNYNWEGPAWGEGGAYPYAGISLVDTTASVEELAALDQVLDDGNLNVGRFRQTPNGRYTFIIEEP